MFHRLLLKALICVHILFLMTHCQRTGTDYDTEPVTNRGTPWRIGYYEGGPYINYLQNLTALVRGLIELGWMEEVVLPPPEDPNDTRFLWRFLSQNVDSEYIEFFPDAYWSCAWDNDVRTGNRREAIARLRDRRDLDLVLAFGTWAGQDLATNDHMVPIIVMSTSDPVGAGIIKSVEDSGFDHVLARCDPGRYLRQIRLFHDIMGFERLGVVYEDTDAGRTYANLAELRTAAEERSFELVECHARDTGLSDEQCREEVLLCMGRIVNEIDAFWVSEHRGLEPRHMPEVLEPLISAGIPTWSVMGARAVRKGVLLSIAIEDFREHGIWYAKTIARIFNGANPGELNQVFEDPSAIAINLETAGRIGFDPPSGLLSAADYVFDGIESE